MAGIFKAYDIRGVYGDALNKEIGYQIGLAWANFIGAGKRIVVGRDERISSPELQAAFIEGVRDGGAHVTNIGLCTTPTTYFACDRGGFDGATMITASHNPGKYNGLKFCREKAIPVGFAEGIDKMEAAIAANQLVKADVRGDYTESDVKDEYLEFLGAAYKADDRFKFAVDAGNGMAGFLMKDILKVLNQEAHELYWDLDFSFPNHEANPLDFNTLRDLQAMVKEKGLDFGVAFDGDADRCFFVDDLGEVVPADILTTLLAVSYLEKTGPSSIIYDIRSSRVVAEKIKEKGGNPVLCRVGHSFMKAKLREEGGVFGGELAGHFYFRDFFFADGAFYTMIQIMNILSEEGKKLSELIAPFKIYHPSGEINFETDRADALIEEAPQKFPGGEISTIDGIRLDFEDWWMSLRKSNTEPLLRLVLEGMTKTTLEAKVTEVKQWLLDSGAVINAGH